MSTVILVLIGTMIWWFCCGGKFNAIQAARGPDTVGHKRGQSMWKKGAGTAKWYADSLVAWDDNTGYTWDFVMKYALDTLERERKQSDDPREDWWMAIHDYAKDQKALGTPCGEKEDMD